MPVVDCLKGDNMDAVQACMDSISPWMEITDEGELNFSLNAINGFIGGSVGVIGTVVSTMIKKNEVKDRIKCNYCEGSGQIICGHCLGVGMISVVTEVESEAGGGGTATTERVVTQIQCPNCEGTGTVVCINCQGSGLSVPDEFLQVLGDEEIGFTEEDFIGLFDETPIPKKAPPTVAATPPTTTKPSAAPEVAKMPQDEPAVGSRPEDFLGPG